MKIQTITARMILDSRGYPTVEVDMTLTSGSFGRASVPSGASTGAHEAHELRDGGEMFGGFGVETALQNIRSITPLLLDAEFDSQRAFDEFIITLDGTPNKTKFGANAILGLSLAFAKASSTESGLELYEYIRNQYEWVREMRLPMPLINVLNGGKHATASTDVQEWMIVPIGAQTFADTLRLGTKVFYALRSIMKERGTSAVGDEGGFPLSHANGNLEALQVLTSAVEKSGLKLGVDIAFALDVAASEFYNEGVYSLDADKVKLTSTEMIEWLTKMTQTYPVVSIEDGLSEEDWENWSILQKNLGSTHQLVGDDLFVTNTEYIQKGIDTGAANAVLIKLNQIGSLTETADAIILAQKNGMNAIISHRSGETEDTSIAHLAVASGAGQIKTGSLSRTERLAKYNELLRISEKLSAFENPFIHNT